MGKIKVNCIHCSGEVERYPSQISKTVFCSRGCRSAYFKEHSTIAFDCHFCGGQKRVRKSSYNHEGNNFCSLKCKGEWQRNGLKGSANPFFNKQHCDETRRNISETKKSMLLVGEKAHNYNTHPIECSECGDITYKIEYLIERSVNHFCSVKCHGAWRAKNIVGENSPNWNPLLTTEDRVRGRKYVEYYMFIKEVLTRDDHTCRICGLYSKWGNGLNAHHLNSYDWDIRNRTNPDNGITLCKACHSSFHKRYGYGKNTREQFREFIDLSAQLAC